MEHYWRVRAVPGTLHSEVVVSQKRKAVTSSSHNFSVGQLYYDKALALVLQKLKVTLPFTDSRKNIKIWFS